MTTIVQLSAIAFGTYYLSVFLRHEDASFISHFSFRCTIFKRLTSWFRYLDGPDRNTLKNHFLGGGAILSLVVLCIVFLSPSSALQGIGMIGTAIVVSSRSPCV